MIPMLPRIVRSSLLAAMAAAAMACSSAPDTQGSAGTSTSTDAPARIETIDAQRLGALPAGEKLVVDMSQPDVAYEFDLSTGPIDFSRVSLRFAGGVDLSMDEWRAQTATVGADVEVRSPDRFFLRPSASEVPVPRRDKAVEGNLPPPCWLQTFCLWVCETEDGPCVYTCVTACT
jgi:hypothetical protein